MKIIQLHAENFKRLRAIDIRPGDEPIVEIAGRNGQGKTSVLDCIWVALAGKAKAPPKPVRKGEEECLIALDLGELRIRRKFTDRDGKQTDSVIVEDADGRRHMKPQQVLDGLMGAIGFDPFRFATLPPDKQAEMLMELVPLPVDLDEFAELDASDFAKRTEINREITRLRGQLASIVVPDDLPAEPIDRDSLTAKLGSAADHNTAIERERASRAQRAETIEQRKREAIEAREGAEQARKRADELIREAETLEAGTARREAELAAEPPLDEPIDTDELLGQIRHADAINAGLAAKAQREAVQKELDSRTAESEALTTALDERDRARKEGLARAKMPVPGMAFGLDEKGRAVLLHDGVPFEQANMAAKIRASVAIAMASNPELRVLRVENGALLDDESMAILRELAAANDYQIWCEVVRPGEQTGIIIEDGAVKAAADSNPDKADSNRPNGDSGDKPEGALV